jgi:hypothetical protein
LNARIEKYILKNEIIRNEQIGFKAGDLNKGILIKPKIYPRF